MNVTSISELINQLHLTDSQKQGFPNEQLNYFQK